MACSNLLEPLNRLDALPVTAQNRLDYYFRTQEFKPVNFHIAKSPIVVLKLYYDRYQQYRHTNSLHPLVVIRSLQTQWHLKSPWQVPILVLYKSFRVLFMIVYGFYARGFWRAFAMLRSQQKNRSV
jgi:hypothetical protein